MQTSEQFQDIAAALAKAQGEMGGAMKDSANPFFKSKYADLASVWDACRGPLASNGIAIIQSPEVTELRVSVETLMVHTSGQWFKNVLSCAVGDDKPQTIGSATTYLRRYALQSFAGVAPEDDDGEAAQGRQKQQAAPQSIQQATAQRAPAGFTDWLDDLRAVASAGTSTLERTWKASKPEYRAHLTSTEPRTWEAIKAAAKAHESVSA